MNLDCNNPAMGLLRNCSVLLASNDFFGNQADNDGGAIIFLANKF